MARIGLNHKLTTAFRPQVDGQTERTNQTLETYLRNYVNYGQNDWVEWLPIAQLAYNTAHHERIKTTPANANFGFTPEVYRDNREKPDNIKAILTSEHLKKLHADMKTELEFVRQQMSKYYNQKRLEGPTFAEGDMVYLSTKNITTKRPTKKLDAKLLGPFPIKKKISKNNYELELPAKIKLYPVFHISLLKSAADTIKVHTAADDNEVDGKEEYEPEKILETKKGKDGFLRYYVK